MMIHLQKVSKSFGSKVLFEDVELTFHPGNRYGLTGPNGAGKSTLLKILMGAEEPTSGVIKVPQKVGILRQNIEDFQQTRAVDAVVQGNQRLWEALEERDRLYEGEMTDEIGMRLGELEEVVAEEDGYTAESEAETLLLGIGIPEELHELALGQIPTDMQFRVLLCQAIFGNPEALLLDEPTNHLDLSSISWLENFLHEYKGVLIVVSHDRHFLNSVTTHIADIDYETAIFYPGNYDAMVNAKTQVRSRAESDAKSKEKKIAQLQEFVAKFSAGTRASQVQSRQKQIQRLQPQELKASNIQRPYIRFMPQARNSGKIVIKAQKLCKSFDGVPVIDKFSLEVEQGDKIAVIGNNGRGKTTLLKMLAGELEPDSGNVVHGHQVDIGYFPQNHSDRIEKGDQSQAFDWLRDRRNGVYDQEIRGVLGKLLFGGDDAFKTVGTLSGGETARLILAGLMLVPSNTFIMDEPNNHLDLEAVSALAWGMEEFDGTMIFAAHDRDLVGTVANKIVAFEDDGVHVYNGNLEAYLASR